MSEELIYDLLKTEGGGLSIRGIANKLYDGDKQIAKEFCFKLSTHPDIEKFVWLDGTDAYRIKEKEPKLLEEPELSKRMNEIKEELKDVPIYKRETPKKEKTPEPRKGSQGPTSPFNWEKIDPKLIIKVKELDEKGVTRAETYETIAKDFDLGITTATKRISFLAKNGLLESYPNRTKNMLLEDKAEAKARFDKYSHRFKDKNIAVIGQGNQLETVAWMEKTHPELTTGFKPKKRGPIASEPEPNNQHKKIVMLNKTISNLETKTIELRARLKTFDQEITRTHKDITDKCDRIDRLKHSLANEIDKVKELTTQLRRKKENEIILNTTHPRHHDTEEDLRQTHLGGIIIIADTVTITKQCKEK